jgi:hypothetical protein
VRHHRVYSADWRTLVVVDVDVLSEAAAHELPVAAIQSSEIGCEHLLYGRPIREILNDFGRVSVVHRITPFSWRRRSLMKSSRPRADCIMSAPMPVFEASQRTASFSSHRA